MRRLLTFYGLVVALLGLLGTVASQSPDAAAVEKHRAPRPDAFGLVFSFGYSGDLMPKEDEKFDELLQKIKKGGFNVVHCTYTPKRLDLCKKHGIKMMVDLLAVEQHHVYKSTEKAKAVCENLRKNPTVWGYNAWNDPVRKTGPGRRRDVNTIRQWDDTHPIFSGTYRTEGMRHLVNADVLGYYDFHWKRGRDQHFPHLLQYRRWSQERNACFYRWLEVDPAPAGKGNVHRCLYSINTSIACGLKGCLWFLGTSLMDRKSLAWTPTGENILQVNQEIAPLAETLAELGQPEAIYSTAITRTANNDPLPAGKTERMPPGLEKNAFPKDFALQPIEGEFLAGVFAQGAKKVIFLANHNAYAEQKVRLKVEGKRTVERFDRKTRKWIPVSLADGVLSFTLPGGGGELRRYGE